MPNPTVLASARALPKRDYRDRFDRIENALIDFRGTVYLVDNFLRQALDKARLEGGENVIRLTDEECSGFHRSVDLLRDDFETLYSAYVVDPVETEGAES